MYLTINKTDVLNVKQIIVKPQKQETR